MTTYGERAKGKMPSLSPVLQLVTLWPGLSAWVLFILCPALFPRNTRMHTYSSKHTNQPKQVILLARNLYRFQTAPQCGSRTPLRVCVDVFVFVLLFRIHSKLEWTDRRMRLVSIWTAGHLSWLSHFFIPPAAITSQSSKLVIRFFTYTCHHLHPWRGHNSF